MQKILLLADVSNLYFTIHKKFGPNARMDYEKLLSRFNTDSSMVYRAIAYTGFSEAGSSFLSALDRIGFEVRTKQTRAFSDGTKKANCDMELAMDAVRILDCVDVVVIASADGDFAPVVDYIQSKGKRCFVIGCNISNLLRDADKVLEVGPTDFEKRETIGSQEDRN